MKRVEIIANHSVEDDITDVLESHNLASHYTKIPNVQGQGNSEPKRGNHVWPEENFILIIYCEEKESTLIAKLISELKEQFPNEGIRYFITG